MKGLRVSVLSGLAVFALSLSQVYGQQAPGASLDPGIVVETVAPDGKIHIDSNPPDPFAAAFGVDTNGAVIIQLPGGLKCSDCEFQINDAEQIIEWVDQNLAMPFDSGRFTVTPFENFGGNQSRIRIVATVIDFIPCGVAAGLMEGFGYTCEVDGIVRYRWDENSSGAIDDDDPWHTLVTISGSDFFDVHHNTTDSDWDGIIDLSEDRIGTDKNDADTDDDGLEDGEEVYVHGTFPSNPDTDGGGEKDGSEVNNGRDPKNDPNDDDNDNDMLTNTEEAIEGTDPNDEDSDGDGLWDGEEVWMAGTDPLNADSDGDTLDDGEEFWMWMTDPLSADTDGGGVDDATEVNVDFTDPNWADDDGGFPFP